MRKRLSLEMAGNGDDLSLILGLEMHKEAASKVFEVGGEDIVWVTPAHSLSLRDSRLKIIGKNIRD